MAGESLPECERFSFGLLDVAVGNRAYGAGFADGDAEVAVAAGGVAAV